MTAVEVITSVERRRRWSRDEKLRIVAESARPGRTASQVAREHRIAPGRCLLGGVSCCRKRLRAALRATVLYRSRSGGSVQQHCTPRLALAIARSRSGFRTGS